LTLSGATLLTYRAVQALSSSVTDLACLATYCGASLPPASPTRDRVFVSRGKRSAVPEARFALSAFRALRTRQNIRRVCGPRQIGAGPRAPPGDDLGRAGRPARRGPRRSGWVPPGAAAQTWAKKIVFKRLGRTALGAVRTPGEGRPTSPARRN
jgi:hypothetical protein